MFILIISLISYMDRIFLLTLFGIFIMFLIFLIKSLKEKHNPRFWGEYFEYKISATNVYVKIPALRTPESKARKCTWINPIFLFLFFLK